MFCGPCETREEEVSPEYWCTSCQEGLCAECQKHHKAMKLSRNHKSILISQYNVDKDVLSAYSSICEKHEKALDIYCPNHETACCSECVSREHDRCVGMTSLPEFLKAFRDSALTSSFKDEIGDCTENCHRLIQHQKDSKQKVHHQIENVKTDMVKARSDINELLNRFEKETVAQAENILEDHCLKIDDSVQTLETKIQCLKDMKRQYETLLANGTDLQVFQCSKETERKIDEEREWLKTIVKGENYEDIEVKVSVDNSYKEKLSNVFEVNVSKTPSNVNIIKDIEQSPGLAQIVSKEKSVEQIIIEDYNTMNLSLSKAGDVTSVIFLPSDVIILANYEGCSLIKHSLKTGENYTAMLSGKPFGLAVVDGQRIAVSFPTLKSVHFFRLLDMSKANEIQFEKDPWGIAFENGLFLVAFRSFELQLRDLAGTLIKTILFSLDDTNIYVFRSHCLNFISSYSSGAIRCLNENGEKLWEIKNKPAKGATNMCADQHGNLFVACMTENSILVVSKDGVQYKNILNFPKPKSICFDQTNSILYVCSKTGGQFKSYKITYT